MLSNTPEFFMISCMALFTTHHYLCHYKYTTSYHVKKINEFLIIHEGICYSHVNKIQPTLQ